MKKIIFSVSVVLAASMLTTSCIGSFGLTHKVLAWNQSVSDKFVNELVFIALHVVPVYQVAITADALIFNTLEFWTGSSPIAAGKKVVKGENNSYVVENDANGYTITTLDGKETVRLNFDEATNTWSIDANGQSQKLMTFIDDNHVQMATANGDMIQVELSNAGVMAYAQVAELPMMAGR